MRKNRHVDRYKRIKRRATDDERGRRRGDIECERKEEPKIWIEEGIQARKEVHQSIRIGRYPKSLLTLEPTKIHTSFHNNHEIKTYTRNVEKRTRLLDDKLYFLHPNMMNTHILRTKSIFLPIAVIGVRIFYCGTHLSSLCRTTVSARRAPSTLKHCATHTHTLTSSVVNIRTMRICSRDTFSCGLCHKVSCTIANPIRIPISM